MLPNPDERPTLTVDMAASVLGISRNSAYEGVRSGQIPSVRIGRRILVPTARLIDLLGIEPSGGRGHLADREAVNEPDDLNIGNDHDA